MQAEPRERFLESQLAYSSTMLHLAESYAKELEGILTEVVGGIEVEDLILPKVHEIDPVKEHEPKVPMAVIEPVQAKSPIRGTRSTRKAISKSETPAKPGKTERKFDLRTTEGRAAHEAYMKRVDAAAKARDAKASKKKEALKATV